MHARVYTSKLYITYQTLLHPDWSCCRDKVNRAASQRSVVFVFAEPSWQLYRDMTNPARLSGLVHLDSFFVTRELSSIYQDCAKTNPTATQTATKLYRRPLGCNNNFHHHLPACPDRFAALPGQLNNPGLVRNVRQIRLIWTGRKQANTSQAKFEWQ